MVHPNKNEKILSEKEVKATAHLLRQYLREEFLNIPETFMNSIEDMIRLQSLAKRFNNEREAIGLSIKEVATRLKVPQYRLRGIEEGKNSEIKPDVLKAYTDFLGLRDWVAKWSEVNEELARKLGIIYIKETT
jgi:ribosome-binding protein aMBF1 (putative translation factor)